MALYTPKTTIQITGAEFAAGVAQLGRYTAGERRGSNAEHMGAVIALASQTEFLVLRQSLKSQGKIPADINTDVWLWGQMCAEQACEFGANEEQAEAAGLGALYRATQQVVRDLYMHAQRVEPTASPALPFPGDLGALPALPAAAYYALTVVGSVAAAAGAWWGINKNTTDAEVSMHAAEMATSLARYQTYVDDLYRRGEAPPDPPSELEVLSNQAGQSKWFALFGGVILGGLAVFGVGAASKARPRRSLPRKANPPRRRRRLAAPKRRRRRNPKKTTRKKVARKKATTRKRNPKKTTRKKATTRKRNPKKTTRKKVARKKATTRKRNPKKTTRKKVARKKNPAAITPKAKFLRSQMRKGRSAKQAAAAWKGKQRLKKINAKRRPKVRRRRRAA